MKKGLSISITIVLLVATLGISISKHYCGNILREASLYLATDGCGDMEMPFDCCEDEHEVYQLDVDYQQTSFDFEINADLLSIQPAYSTYSIENNIDQMQFQVIRNNGPPDPSTDIYIQFQRFLL